MIKKELLCFILYATIIGTLIPAFVVAEASDVPFANEPFDVNNIPEPVPPPKEVRDFFDLSPFYQQWINVAGFPVLASADASPYALKETAWVIWQMIGHRKDILKAIAQERRRLSVLSINESLGDLPEYDHNSPLAIFGAHTRDVAWNGATAAEENLFWSHCDYCYSFLVHEFAHAIHGGLEIINPTFDNRLNAAYNAAIVQGLWKDAYSATNRGEYWAEGAGSWFNAAWDLNPIKTREDLKAYDPRLANLFIEIFGDGDWRHTMPAKRMHLPHLQGFDPQEAFRLDGLPLWAIKQQKLEQQLRDPNSDGDGKWVRLKLYHPSMRENLIESSTRGNYTHIVWVKLIRSEISFYELDAYGNENWVYTATTKEYFDLGTRAGVVWLMKDHNGEDLALFRAEERVGRVLITPTLHLITPGLSKISGDNESGVPGAVLANPFVVEVRDENGSVLEGISVMFTVTTGNGTLSVNHTTTDENGRAESTLTLGPNLGTTTVEVSATGIGETVAFKVVAVAAVDIPDANLRAAIETARGKAPGESITGADMAMLPRLDARNEGISDLTGLEHATNLTELYLGAEHIEGEGWLNSNSVSNLSPLAGLTNLTRLGLRDNTISDLFRLLEA